MENRRYATARKSKPFQKKKRFYREDGEKPYGQKKYKSRYKRNDNRDNKFSYKKKKFNPRGDKRFQSKRRFPPRKKGFKPAWKKREQLPRIVSDMQVTDGKHRGKYLKSTDSPKVRPTARRIREIMFRILFRQIRAKRFLDLCAGSGTVGLEAISRGAIISTFVERSAKLCSFIRKNMESLEIKEGHGEIFEMEVIPFLKKMAKRKRFWDVVYFDPPYDTDYDAILKYFERGVAIKPNGTLIIEHHSEMFFPERIGVLKRWKVVVRGETAISFYDRKS